MMLFATRQTPSSATKLEGRTACVMDVRIAYDESLMNTAAIRNERSALGFGQLATVDRDEVGVDDANGMLATVQAQLPQYQVSCPAQLYGALVTRHPDEYILAPGAAHDDRPILSPDRCNLQRYFNRVYAGAQHQLVARLEGDDG